MKLIVGLGNPGEEHHKTRHNLGFAVLDEMVKKLNLADFTKEDKFKAEIVKNNDLIFVKPQTFMNNSGMSVTLLVNYFKIKLEDVIIIHDELDLPLGKIKVRIGGAAAGHHGVESVIKALDSDEFVRVRLGIGELKIHNAEKFVLEPFRPDEKSKVKHMLKQAIEAIELVLKEGVAKAQGQFN